MGNGSPRSIIIVGLAVILTSGALLLFSNWQFKHRQHQRQQQRSQAQMTQPVGIAFDATTPAKPGGRLVLLGSMHLLPKTEHPLPTVYTDGIAAADEILFEIDPSEKSSPSATEKILVHTVYSDKSSWQDHVAPEVSKRVESLAKAEGIALHALNGKRVYVVAQAVGQNRLLKAGYSRQWGVETRLARAAQGSGKPIGGLESLESQLQVFSSLTESEEEILLIKTLDELAATDDFGLRVAEAWWRGNADRIAALTANSMADHPKLADRLYLKRNQQIAATLDARLQPSKTLLVIIGAAHLCGDQSVVELLRERGYRVQKTSG